MNDALLLRLDKSSYIPALDAVRGIAACLVVVAHIFGPVKLGGMAVLIFFVLSGFLITWLLLRELERTGEISVRSFYARRTLRIFPAFYVFWIICVLVAHLTHGPFSWGEAIASFFYMGDYYTAMHSSHAHQIMGITWSLGVEEKFYLLWPAICVMLRKDLAKLFRVSLSLAAFIWLYRALACIYLHLPVDYLRYSFDSRFADILLGCAFALALKLRRLEPVLGAVARVKVFPLLLAGILVGLTMLERHLSDRLFYVFALPFSTVVVAVLLIQLIFEAHSPGYRWLEHPVLRFLGRISYSLYLYHIVAITSIEHLFPHLRLRWLYPLMCAGSVTAAYMSYRFIEQPFLQLKNYFEKTANVHCPPQPEGATRRDELGGSQANAMGTDSAA
ncbi:MAG TPA: acyltransferase [Terriglobales bacterium]